jgi:hypothetical protein
MSISVSKCNRWEKVGAGDTAPDRRARSTGLLLRRRIAAGLEPFSRHRAAVRGELDAWAWNGGAALRRTSM